MAKEKVAKKGGAVKKITPYNRFMKTELAVIKEEKPGVAHKEAFKMAAARWKDSPDNPKNTGGAKDAKTKETKATTES